MKFPTKIPNRKTKCKSAKTSNSNNLNESLDILRLDPSLSLPDTKIPQYQRAAAGKDGTYLEVRAQGCPNYSTNACVAAGFCFHHTTAHQTRLVWSADLSLQTVDCSNCVSLIGWNISLQPINHLGTSLDIPVLRALLTGGPTKFCQCSGRG